MLYFIILLFAVLVICFSIMILWKQKITKLENDTKEKNETLKRIFDESPMIMYIANIDSLYITEMNKAGNKFFNHRSHNKFSKIKLTSICNLSEEKIKNIISEICSKNGGNYSFSYKPDKDSSQKYIRVHALPVTINGEKYIFSILDDFTNVQNKLNYLSFWAYHDSLTGLPNRKFFLAKLKEKVKETDLSQDKKLFALFYLDINNFKLINDNFGHDAGDLLLCEVGKRIKSCLRKNDILARIGGDEFLILISDIIDRSDAKVIAERIFEVLYEPIQKEKIKINISASIGMSFYPSTAKNVDDLIKEADLNMYSFKKVSKLS